MYSISAFMLHLCRVKGGEHAGGPPIPRDKSRRRCPSAVPPVTGPVPIQPALVGHGPVAVIERPLPHGCANGVASSQSCPGTMPKSHYFNGGSAAISTGWAAYTVA